MYFCLSIVSLSKLKKYITKYIYSSFHKYFKGYFHIANNIIISFIANTTLCLYLKNILYLGYEPYIVLTLPLFWLWQILCSAYFHLKATCHIDPRRENVLVHFHWYWKSRYLWTYCLKYNIFAIRKSIHLSLAALLLIVYYRLPIHI